MVHQVLILPKGSASIRVPFNKSLMVEPCLRKANGKAASTGKKLNRVHCDVF